MNAALFAHISSTFLKGDPVETARPQSGGCLNEVYCLDLRSGQKVLVKFNHFDQPQAFRLEAEALNLLRTAFHTPEVKGYGRYEQSDYLVLEWIETGARSAAYWPRFGAQLATLHQHTQTQHGWKEDNYIGPLTQYNTLTTTWNEFFIQFRLEPQLRKAVNEKKMNDTNAKQFDRLFSKLEQYIPEEAPALLHGDLWGGNVMTGADGLPVLIDPALYYGHREIELAYTQLFDRFDPELYNEYENIFPLQPSFDERVRLHQLYPLMVHVNLFGGGYVRQVEEIIRYYI